MAQLNEMVETLKDVAVRLDDLGIEYMVTGSFAMSVYATARMTMDIDVILEISSADAERFEMRFINDYYVDALSIKRAYAHNSMFNIISNLTGVKVDCIVKRSEKFESEKFTRRWLSQIDGVEFWVIAKEDLIISKLQWAKDSHSEMQFRDIRSLIESGVENQFLFSAIDRVDLNETWKSFEQWKTQAAK